MKERNWSRMVQAGSTILSGLLISSTLHADVFNSGLKEFHAALGTKPKKNEAQEFRKSTVNNLLTTCLGRYEKANPSPPIDSSRLRNIEMHKDAKMTAMLEGAFGAIGVISSLGMIGLVLKGSSPMYSAMPESSKTDFEQGALDSYRLMQSFSWNIGDSEVYHVSLDVDQPSGETSEAEGTLLALKGTAPLIGPPRFSIRDLTLKHRNGIEEHLTNCPRTLILDFAQKKLVTDDSGINHYPL